MARYLRWDTARWALPAALVCYIVVYPVDAAASTRSIVGGAIEVTTGLAQVCAILLASLLASVVGRLALGAGTIAWLVDPRRVQRYVRRADIDREREVSLMVAYLGFVGGLAAAGLAAWLTVLIKGG